MTSEPIHVHNQDLQKEKEWHEKGFYVDSGHWTSHPLFASRERHWLHNEVQGLRFYSGLFKYIKAKPYRKNARILLAPVGNGRDMFYLLGAFQQIYGLDISSISLSNCPRPIIIQQSDILFSGYDDQSFDVIICSQFLHHVLDVGFEPFIKEFFRLLREGGVLAILEPSNLYPLSWVAALARKAIGNVTGLVEGERPISPFLLTKTLNKIGFKNIRTRGMLYTHVRIPSSVQHVIDATDFIFRLSPPFKLFANSVGWFCTKSKVLS
jgi:SAM-dependent methyltransferase